MVDAQAVDEGKTQEDAETLAEQAWTDLLQVESCYCTFCARARLQRISTDRVDSLWKRHAFLRISPYQGQATRHKAWLRRLSSRAVRM